MKKLVFYVLVIFLTFVIAITNFAGCSQISQLSKLEPRWETYEKFEYVLTYDNSIIGKMFMVFKRIQNSSITINNTDYEFNGSYCSMQLNITEGENKGDSIRSEVAFDMHFAPIVSFKTTQFGEKTTTSNIIYNTGKGISTLIVNDKKSTFKHKTTAYDNEMLYLLVRASDLSDKKYSMSFSSPNNLENKLNEINVTKNGTEKIITDLGEIECNNYTIKADAKYGEGVSLIVSIAEEIDIDNEIESENSLTIIHPIVRIKEGSYTYTLRSVSLDAEE